MVLTAGAYPETTWVKARRARDETDDETWVDGVAPTLNAFDNASETRSTVLVAAASRVRRLTPRECERLMGWPDDHTRWGANGRELSDSARYRMIGNGVVAPVAEWLAKRLLTPFDVVC
jgi:DNA (cytosine-5)-methyltransferase 1